MKKIRYLFLLVLFTLFLPSVDALSYDISTSLSKIDNNRYDIRLSFDDVSDTDYGIGACIFNVSVSDGIKLNGEMRTVGSWNIDGTNMFLVESAKPALTKTEFLIIPVKVDNSGKVTISNIKCSDDMEEVQINDKTVDIVYKVDNSNNFNNNVGNNNIGGNTPNKNNSNSNNGVNTPNNNSDTTDNNEKDDVLVKDSNCDLKDIILSEGEIDFESSIVEYEVSVNSIERLQVTPVLASEKSEFVIDREADKVVIKVTAEDGTVKNYTIYLEETLVKKENNNKYIPIFIGITCLLVLINIIRVGRKFVPKKG